MDLSCIKSVCTNTTFVPVCGTLTPEAGDCGLPQCERSATDEAGQHCSAVHLDQPWQHLLPGLRGDMGPAEQTLCQLQRL